MSEKQNILIIPDVHGRSFWEDAVKQYQQKCSTIVFLGDYTDPYPSENISWKSALEQLRQIITLKQSAPQRVVLLLGNHDLHYMYEDFVRGSRYSDTHASQVKELLLSHASLFQFAHEEVMLETRYLFTHAGVLPLWYQMHCNEIGPLNAESLNRLNTPYHREHMLSEVSFLRGGLDAYGSFLWSDVNEWGDDSSMDGFYQIFGHTRLVDPLVTPHWACLDSCHAIMLHLSVNDDPTCVKFYVL